MPPTEDWNSFLKEGGEVGNLMRRFDWSGSPLGSPDNWPQPLRTVVSLLLNAKFPMFIAWGPELGFLYNDSYAEILGGKHPAALGRRFRDVWAEIWDDISPLIEQTMSGEAAYRENLPLTMHRKGYDEQTWFTFSYSPVLDETGKVAGMFCACTETTQQVLAERHHLEENERLRQLFQQAPGIMAVLRDPHHVFELVNDAYMELVGHRVQVGMPVREALPELAGQGFFELLDQVYRTGEPFVGRGIPIKLQRRQGAGLEERFVDFIYQPIRDYKGQVSGIFLEGNDVTDAVRAHNALRESEERLRQLANTIHHLAWIADANGEVNWYNDRWYEYTGTTLEQMRGWGWSTVIHPEDLPALLKRWRDCIVTGEPYEVRVPMRGADGSYRTFFIRAAPVRDAEGNIVQWFGTNTDVTDAIRAQEELQTANRRKDEFLAMLAHELRNPLAPISTAAELLKRTALDPDRIRQTSEIIARQVSHMTELVDDLLDVSRVTRGLVTLEKVAVNLGTIVADSIEQVHSLIGMKRQHLSINMADVPVIVNGDRTRLTQVFSNLLNNAAKYTPEQGRIELTLRLADGEAEFSVHDDGIGIAPALQPHIFDLFAQAERSPDRSQGGLGLGLALVKSLVSLHGGRVSVHSKGLGKGSTFMVRLPLAIAQPRAETVPTPRQEIEPASSAARLLIVDDNVDAARTLALLLETAGHAVRVAHGGQQALALVREHAPEMLFIDIGLPDIDGYALAGRLRAIPETSAATLVAVTGYGQPSDKEQAKRAGFDHHLVKPVKADAILGLVSERIA